MFIRTQRVCKKMECQLLLSFRMSRVNSSSNGMYEPLNPACQETQWETRKSFCSWRTVCCGRDPCWSSSWRAAAWGKDPHSRSPWRAASHGSSGAGKRVRRKEWWSQSIFNRLQPPFLTCCSDQQESTVCPLSSLPAQEGHLRQCVASQLWLAALDHVDNWIDP